MKTLLSIFDYSGQWCRHYEDRGHNVVTMDLKSGQDANDFSVEWFFEDAGLEDVDGMLMAPPCTDFTNAGAQYWPRKDADGTTSAAIHIALQALRAVEFWKPDFWALENPRGRIQSIVPILGKPRFVFDPCDFAGYVTTPDEAAQLDVLRARNGEGEWTAEEIALVKRTNAYTKETRLWGDFDLPEKRRIEPVKVCKQGSWLQRLGGKSEKTKAARSETPDGFAQAFTLANCWQDEARMMAKRAARYVRDLEDGEPFTAAAALKLAAQEFGEMNAAEFLNEYKAAEVATK